MKPVLIFDLDGTVLSVNSFPYWARYMLSGAFAGLSGPERLALSFKTAGVLFNRKILGHSHCDTKRRLQMLWAQALEKDAAKMALYNFNVVLHGHLRPNLRRLVAMVAERKADALLATSASEAYAHEFGRSLGFMHVLASGEVENRAEAKRDNVLAMLAALGWSDQPRIFFTDHMEDLPLIRQCLKTFWVGSDDEAAAIRAVAPQANIVASRDLPASEIMQLLEQAMPSAWTDKSPAALAYG